MSSLFGRGQYHKINKGYDWIRDKAVKMTIVNEQDLASGEDGQLSHDSLGKLR